MLVKLLSGPHHPSAASGGAIQKRLRNSVGSNASPSRSSLTLGTTGNEVTHFTLLTL